MQNGIIQPIKPGLPGATPVGMAGSIPTMKKSPSTGGRPPGANPPPKPGLPPDPYDKLNTDTIKNIKILIEKGINAGALSKESNAADMQNYLSDIEGWDSSRDDDRILELMTKYDIRNRDEFFQKLLRGDLEKSPDELNTPSEIPGVGQNIKPITKGSSMSKKVFLKDGVLVEASADVDVTPVLNALSLSSRRVEACVKTLASAKLVRYAEDALDGAPEADKGGLGDLSDLAAPKGGDPVASAIKSLKSAVEELESAMDGADKFKSDKSDDLGFDDSKKLDEGMDMGKGALDKADKAITTDLPMVSKGIEASAKSSTKAAEFPAFMKKKDDDKKEEKDEKKDCKEDAKEEKDEKKEEKKEAASGDSTKGTKDQKAMDIAMGKDGKDEKKVSAAEIMSSLAAKLAEISDDHGMIKESQFYPFKDLNKQNADETNKTTAKDEISEINSEIKGQPKKDKENARIAPKDILDGDAKPSYESGATKKIDVKTAEKLRQHSVQNAVAKAKLAVELASQQQLKGLIANPMHTAMVKNMVEAGVTKEAAEVIAYNTMIDGYEPMQKEVTKEAFDTFMNHTLDEFVKVAKYTNDFIVKEAGFTEETTITKTASAVEGSVALKTPASDSNRKAVYSAYWSDVAAERRRS